MRTLQSELERLGLPTNLTKSQAKKQLRKIKQQQVDEKVMAPTTQIIGSRRCVRSSNNSRVVRVKKKYVIEEDVTNDE